MPRIISKNRKICLILPSLQAGGMERVMAQLANYFVSVQGLEVHLILFGSTNDLFYHLDSRIIISRISGLKIKNRVYLFFRTIIYIRSKVREICPDAVLSFGTHWNNLVLIALLGSKNKVFVSDRGSPYRKYIFPHPFLRKILYKYASGIIAQTGIAYRISTVLFPKVPVKVIGNPINALSKSFRNNSQDKVILTVGRLIDTKHHDRLIEIFSKLNNSGWKLIIVGGNALKQNNYLLLEKLIREKSLSNQVKLIGSQKDVDSFYASSNIFAFTSSVEGFPNVVGEALSAGLPVVSYNCIAGPSEMIIDGENGFLVPVFDDEKFAQKLQLLMDNEELRLSMGENARHSMDRFTVEKIGQLYLDFMLNSIDN
jgi:GalNAc-alpha-(1->4)-GalNAc-alpha-(1->3)-diNAcBac-PP-undecaprenol alpha-1,4-N-acetyl-D-galactosaminyltransferase